jgi:hypoxia up-regulated 1
VENLLENIDMKIEVKREKFLELNADFLTRVTRPIELALMTSSVTLAEISEVILMGAGTRVPRVQVSRAPIYSLLLSFSLSRL